MNRRSIGPKVKQICLEHGIKTTSVTLGRGTAHHWVYIKTDKNVPWDLQEKVEACMVKEQLCGSYFSDSLPGRDTWTPSVTWSAPND